VEAPVRLTVTRADLDPRFTLFAVTFAVCAIFETSAHGLLPRLERTSVLYGATTLAGLLVLARPTAVGSLLALAACFAAALMAAMPRIPNHGIFEITACLTILAGAVASVIRTRAQPTPRALYDAFAPPLRLSLVVLYLWAVVHKLNTDFFDFEVSCGVFHLAEVRRYLWFLVPDTTAMQYFGVYGTILVETAIALLLLLRPTRYAAIALALGFHWVIGSSYARFSAMLVAMLTLFVDADLIAGAAPWERLRAGPGRSLHLAVVGALAVITVAVGLAHVGAASSPLSLHMVNLAWLGYGLAATVAFGTAVVRSKRFVAPPSPILRFAVPVLAVVPLLLIVNGATPHLGIRNTLAFAMYSNLRTEGGRTNHLFLPATLQMFDHERDLVTIVSSSDPVLAGLSRRQWSGSGYFYSYVVGARDLPKDQAPAWRLPYLGLRDRITTLKESGARNVRVVYERAGVVRELESAEREPDLATASVLERKLLFMRAIPETDRVYCMW
jgi:hypothetical protein